MTDASDPELSRTIETRQADGRRIVVDAAEDERLALARRFDLVRIDRLHATLDLSAMKDGVVDATGTLSAQIVQSCAISGEDLSVAVNEPLAFRFVPLRHSGAVDEEIELDADECDEIDYEGSRIDVGEAVAQSLGLAIDPYATGPEAEDARSHFSDADANPFAALKDFKPNG